MATTKEKWQEIANRGLQDRFDPETRAKFDEAVRRGLITTQQQQVVSANNPDVPGIEGDLLQPQVAPVAEQVAIDDPNNPLTAFNRTAFKNTRAGEVLAGAEDVAKTLVTAATGGALGFGLGAAEGIVGELTGRIPEGEGLGEAERLASELTFEPRTKIGQDVIKFITEKLSVLPPIAGATTLGGGLRLKGPKIPGSKARQIRGVLSDEIKAGNINAGNIAKALDSDGSLIKNPRTKAAIKLLGAGDEAYSMAINFEKMNSATKKEAGRILDQVQANKNSGDPKFINKNRPANIIGQSIAKSANKLNDIKKGSGRLLGRIMELQDGKKTVNTKPARDSFIAALDEADIKVVFDDKGRMIADTTSTLTNIDEVIKGNKLNTVLARVQGGKMSAKEAHKLKRNIRELVSFDPSAPGAVKVSIEIENAIKKLASDLGDSVSEVSKPYAKQNKIFSESIDALKKADKSLGNALMIGDELAEAKFGALSKRIATNISSKEQVIDMVNSLEEALVTHGKGSNVDIERLVQTVGFVEDIFKLEPQQARFGFQSRIAKGALETATTGTPGIQLTKSAIDAAAKLSKLDFNDKMKALRLLSGITKKTGNK